MKLARPRLLDPLRNRDFALLTAGWSGSFLGDGFFYVALAWQVYKLSNTPTALSVVSIAWSLPTVCLLLVGGVAGDRLDRRRVMAASDLLRAVSIGTVGVLSVSGLLQLWQLFVLMPFFGAGDAFFNPAADAIVPDLLPAEELTQANALVGVLRSLMGLLLGPALGGLVVGLAGAGPAFLVDAASFLVSALTVSLIAAHPHVRTVSAGVRQAFEDVRGGLRFVRANAWCWATLAAAAVSLLVFIGPWMVIVPYLIKNALHGGPTGLGLTYAFGGIGSIIMSLALGQHGLPRRSITAMYLGWGVGVAALALFGVMTALWQALLISLLFNALMAVGQLSWMTLMQRLVPSDLLARVSSLDWLISTGFVPISYALTGPSAALFGPRITIAAGGLLGGVVFIAFLFVPGVRDPERTLPAHAITTSSL